MALIIKLDQYVLNRVCEKLAELKKQGYKNFQIAVNISNRHSVKKDFVDNLCEIIKTYNISPGDIQIEFTNNIAINKIEEYKTMFERLKECGVDIIVNNMEIKYEALSLFKELPIDEIKLTSEYISNASKLNKDILNNITLLCKNMGYRVVVGSIESEQELINSIQSNADKIQGSFLFKKIEEEEIEGFLSKYSTYEERISSIISNAKQTKV